MRANGVAVSLMVLMSLGAASAARAQQASLLGTATDESKAVLPGVSVTATNLETGASSASITNDRGEYRISNLLPGKYSVKAELTGFAAVVIEEVELLVGQNATAPF